MNLCIKNSSQDGFRQRTLIVGGSITVLLVSSFTGIDSNTSLHTNYNTFSCLVESDPVTLETSCTEIPALSLGVFSGLVLPLQYCMTQLLISVTKGWNKKQPISSKSCPKNSNCSFYLKMVFCKKPKSHQAFGLLL